MAGKDPDLEAALGWQSMMNKPATRQELLATMQTVHALFLSQSAMHVALILGDEATATKTAETTLDRNAELLKLMRHFLSTWEAEVGA